MVPGCGNRFGRDGEFVIIIDNIRKFIAENCPYIKGKKTLKLNCLEGEAPAMTIEQVPAEPIIKKYTDGGSMRQAVFVIASREEYDTQLWKQVESVDFYEKLSDWFEEISFKKQMPDLGDGFAALRFETLTTGYLFSVSPDMARYQIQCRLIYTKEGRFK